jgi:hypothetical protein
VLVDGCMRCDVNGILSEEAGAHGNADIEIVSRTHYSVEETLYARLQDVGEL